MHSQRQEPQFIDDELGGITTSHGPFMLKSAFQPIFSQAPTGQLTIQAFEALIRPFREGRPVSPGQFFQSVEADDALYVDRLCRGLHLRNLRRVNRSGASLFINFNPSFYASAADIDHEVSGFTSLCGELGISAGSIVCEITEQGSNDYLLSLMVEKLRAAHFKIAVDDYGADDSDLQRVERLQPDIVKFDAAWVHRFVETLDGKHVLRGMVRTFREKGMASLFEGLEEDSLGGDLRQHLAVGRAGNGDADGTRGSVTREPHHAHIVAEILATELSPDPDLARQFEDLLFRLKITKGTTVLISRRRQTVKLVTTSQLHRLQRLLRRCSSDHDGQMVGRTSRRSEHLDLLGKKLNQGRRVEQGLCFLKEEGLVRRAPALGNKKKLVFVAVDGGDIDLSRKIGAGILLFVHGQGRVLRIAQILFRVGLENAS